MPRWKREIRLDEKKFKQGKSYLPESYGQKYASYWVGFKMSQVLKRNLNS